MNGVEDADRTLITQVALQSIVNVQPPSTRKGPHQEHIDSSLLPFVLEIVDVRPGNALCGVTQNACRTFRSISLRLNARLHTS